MHAKYDAHNGYWGYDGPTLTVIKYDLTFEWKRLQCTHLRWNCNINKTSTHNNGMVKYMFSMSRLVDRRASKRNVCVCVCAVCNHAMHTSGAQSKEKDEHYVDNGKNKDRTKTINYLILFSWNRLILLLFCTSFFYVLFCMLHDEFYRTMYWRRRRRRRRWWWLRQRQRTTMMMMMMKKE